MSEERELIISVWDLVWIYGPPNAVRVGGVFVLSEQKDATNSKMQTTGSAPEFINPHVLEILLASQIEHIPRFKMKRLLSNEHDLRENGYTSANTLQ